MTQFINPYTDFGFKWLFGTEKNKALLIDFLNAMFDGMEHVEDLEYRQHEHIGAGAADRHIIFDVYCVTSTGGAYHRRDAERASECVPRPDVILCGGSDSRAGTARRMEL